MSLAGSNENHAMSVDRPKKGGSFQSPLLENSYVEIQYRFISVTPHCCESARSFRTQPPDASHNV